MKRLLPTSLLAGALVLGLTSPALAGNPSPPPPPLPPDQLVLTGYCLTVDTVLAAADQALGLYVPGDQPAGVIINGNWVPAAYLAANAGSYAVTTGCPTPTPTTVAPVPSSTTTLAPTTTSTVPVTSSTSVPSTTTTAAPTTTTARRCHKR